MSNEKTKSSIKNFSAALVGNVAAIAISLVAQKLFIEILGAEYLGLNGLFTNVISMLAIVELGIGSAIIYNLYKPLAEQDYETVRSLMLFYKKAYRIIALITLLLGLLVVPFLHFFIGEVTISVNVYVVYLLFLADAIFSYFLSYRRSILYANQKNYIISIIHTIYLVLLNIAQLSILYLTKNYYLYLIVKVVMRVFENYAISFVALIKYPHLQETGAKPLEKYITKDINKKVRGLLFHKIATFVVLGTDNIIISRYLGLVEVGLYSNYYLIINALNTIFGQAIIALTPSVGHLLVEENPEKSFDVFKKIRFATFWISTFSAIGLLVVSAPFIKFWLGSDYVLDLATVAMLTFNFFQKMMRNSYVTFKEAAGIYHEDRFVPVFESILNIIASIILVKIMGLPGVFLGTIISGLSLWCYSYPKYVYKKIFRRSYMSYAKETLGYILAFVLIATSTYFIVNLFPATDLVSQLIISLAATVLIPNLFITMLFMRTDSFKYFLETAKNLLLRRKKTN